MAGYDFHRNGGYKTYDSPGYYSVIGSPPEGRRRAAVGYNVHSSNVTKAEEVVEYRRVMGTANNKHSPRKELLKDYGGDKPFLVSDRADDYHPRYRNQMIHGPSKGSPRSNVNKDSSPRSGDYHRASDYGKHNKFSSDSDDDDDDDDDDDSDEYEHEYENKQFNASPRKDQSYRETIDSEEARRRYGKPSSGGGASAEGKNRKIIDAREAARKYKGVFVSK